jgi:hypothetical protein
MRAGHPWSPGEIGQGNPPRDLKPQAGEVMQVDLEKIDKPVLVAVYGLEAEPRRDGKDFVYMTCSEA